MWIGKVVVEFGQCVDHLWVDRLNCQFRPARHVASGNVLLTKGLLATREDVLQVLQARRLQGWQQVADYRRRVKREFKKLGRWTVV